MPQPYMPHEGKERQQRHLRFFINGVEDSHAKNLVEATETRHVTRSIQYRFETVVDSIPGGSSRMDIIAGKAD